MTTIADQTKPLPEVPYRGIESFRFIDQRLFCAREDETWELLSQILINRGVLLYGDSGCGKSSLINAGLIPAALKENLWPHRIRIQPRSGREIKVERIPTEADGRPPYLPSDLVDPASPNQTALSFEISVKEFHEQLKSIKSRKPNEPHPLLIVDQFEEFITLFEEASRVPETAIDALGTQRLVLSVFTSILHDDSLPVKLLFVFREEYLAKLNILFKTAPELLDQYVRLLPPRVEEAEQIILAPFIDGEMKARFSGAYQRHVSELEGTLGKKIAEQIQQRSENGFINLTELQIVCRKLWESPDPVKYFQANGWDIQKVLEGYFVDALKKLGDFLAEPAIALLGHMVTTSTNTRNIVSEPDLLFFEKDNFTPERIKAALNALVESKLVRREPRHKIHFYEIVSEFLVPWIREKKLTRAARLEAARIAAETKQRLERVEKERRYLIFGAIALGSFLVLSAYLGFKAYQAYGSEKKAREELVATQRERDEAEKLIKTLSELTSQDAPVRLAAIKELIALDQKGKLPRDLVPFIVAVVASDQSKEITFAGKYFFYSLKELNAVESSGRRERDSPPGTGSDESKLSEFVIQLAEQNTILADSRPSTTLAPRIYFQLASDSQRSRADKIADGLRSVGFNIPAYEVVNTPVTGNELRFYKPRDSSDSASINSNLDKALQKIKAVDGPGWTARELPPSSSVRPGHFELWFAEDRQETPSPTAAPSAEIRVVLKLSFVDEQGNEIRTGNPLVTLERSPFNGRQIIEKASTLSARPGTYILFVQMPGFQLYRAELNLQGAEVAHKATLIRRKVPAGVP